MEPIDKDIALIDMVLSSSVADKELRNQARDALGTLFMKMYLPDRTAGLLRLNKKLPNNDK